MFDRIQTQLESCMAGVDGWSDELSDADQVVLQSHPAQLAFTRLALIDGYWRIRQTTPMVLSAIAATDAAGDFPAARFWSLHLQEELGHDRMMHADLVRHYGSETRVSQVLAANPISPPAAALVGYFSWQVNHGSPHLLVLLRLFLETYVPRVSGRLADQSRSTGIELATLAHHAQADSGHAEECRAYFDGHFGLADHGRVQWTLEFITNCLLECQLWTARRVLGGDHAPTP